MSDYKERQENEIFTKVLKAGRRTYFFDVRETKAGDYYLTITESKKNFNENGEASFEKHKIYLYKDLLESRNYRAQDLGRLSGVGFAEGFTSERLLVLKNFSGLFL
jgi:hypothetical protein